MRWEAKGSGGEDEGRDGEDEDCNGIPFSEPGALLPSRSVRRRHVDTILFQSLPLCQPNSTLPELDTNRVKYF